MGQNLRNSTNLTRTMKIIRLIFLAVASEFAADNQGGTGGQEYGNYIHPERESENTRNEMNACIHYCGGNNYNALDEITKCTGRH